MEIKIGIIFSLILRQIYDSFIKKKFTKKQKYPLKIDNNWVIAVDAQGYKW